MKSTLGLIKIWWSYNWW